MNFQKTKTTLIMAYTNLQDAFKERDIDKLCDFLRTHIEAEGLTEEHLAEVAGSASALISDSLEWDDETKAVDQKWIQRILETGGWKSIIEGQYVTVNFREFQIKIWLGETHVDFWIQKKPSVAHVEVSMQYLKYNKSAYFSNSIRWIVVKLVEQFS